MSIDAYVKAIDFVMEHSDNLCKKCVHFKEILDNIDCCCKYLDDSGNTACRDGVIEYFKNEVRNG